MRFFPRYLRGVLVNQVLNVSVVGTGWIANKVHLPYVCSSLDLNLIGVFDEDEERGKITANEFQTVAFSTLKEALERSDVIIICTPPETHMAIVEQALVEGKYVVCEKPLTTDIDEALKLKNLANTYKSTLFCCFTNRYRQDVLKAKSAIEKGLIGEPQFIRASWLRGTGIPGTKGALEAGVLWDLGSHLVDLVFWLSEWSDVRNINASLLSTATDSKSNASWYGQDLESRELGNETIAAMVQFSENKALHLTASWMSHIVEDKTEVVIVGDEGSIVINSVFGWSPDRQKAKGRSLVIKPSNSDPIVLDQDYEHSEYKNQLDVFFEGCRSGNRFETELDTTLQTIRLLNQIQNNVQELERKMV